MSKTVKEFSEMHFDTRTRKRYLSLGVITQDDYQNYLKNLPNDEDNFELAPFEDDDLDLDPVNLETADDESPEAN